MNPDGLSGTTESESLTIRCAFQYQSNITDLEFLKFWESLTPEEIKEYRDNAIKMGFLAFSGGVVVKLPHLYR